MLYVVVCGAGFLRDARRIAKFAGPEMMISICCFAMDATEVRCRIVLEVCCI